MFFMRDVTGEQHTVLTIVDQFTRFTMCEVLRDAKAATVWRAFEHNWIAHCDAPSLLICDNGSEFVGADFVSECGALGIRVMHTAAGAPWQNGVAERAGASVKAVAALLIKEHCLQGEKEVTTPAAQA